MATDNQFQANEKSLNSRANILPAIAVLSLLLMGMSSNTTEEGNVSKFSHVQPDELALTDKREAMASSVEQQVRKSGFRDRKRLWPIVEAIRNTPRHLFVPLDERPKAYQNHPLPIGYGQTISDPYIVAIMTYVLDLKPEDKVLEIGTGSG